MIAELENSIATYKDEYAALISETQAIKSEMERVQNRVSRSMQLLDSLSSEKHRWEEGSRTFDDQMSTIIGDALLSAAMLAYAGFFDQQYRESMWAYWSDHLRHAEIKFKPELSFADYLSTADERLEWQARSLPADTLCTENAIMLKRWNRYPLVIDPSGQASIPPQRVQAAEAHHHQLPRRGFPQGARELVALRKPSPHPGRRIPRSHPQSCPQQGTPPYRRPCAHPPRQSGHRLFALLQHVPLHTRPFRRVLARHLQRVTFVNFTMTRSSLQSQSLDQVLKVERPDTDRKRTDLMKLQGEFRLRLRHLERSLLTALTNPKATSRRRQGHRHPRDAQEGSCRSHLQGRGDRRHHARGRPGHRRVRAARQSVQLGLLCARPAPPHLALLPVLPALLPRHLRLCPAPQPAPRRRLGSKQRPTSSCATSSSSSSTGPARRLRTTITSCSPCCSLRSRRAKRAMPTRSTATNTSSCSKAALQPGHHHAAQRRW